jgi:hypothetical protein
MEKSRSEIQDGKIQILDLGQACQIRNTALMINWIRIGIGEKLNPDPDLHQTKKLDPVCDPILAQKSLQEFKNQE